MKTRGFMLVAPALVLGLGVYVAPPASGRTLIRLGETAPPAGQSVLIGGMAIAPDFRFLPSDASTLVGGYATPPGVTFPSPVFWFEDDPTRNGGIIPHTLPGTPFGEAVSMNDDGTVGGTILGGTGPQAFLYSRANGLQKLGPGYCTHVDDQGNAFGSALHNGVQEAAMFDRTGKPPQLFGIGKPSTIVRGNIYGNLAGTVDNGDKTLSATTIEGGILKLLPGLGGHNAAVNDVNNVGVLIGIADLPDGSPTGVAWFPKPGANPPYEARQIKGSTFALSVTDNGTVVVDTASGLQLANLNTPGAAPVPLNLFHVLDFLNGATPFRAEISAFGVVSAIQMENGIDHPALSIPEATPLDGAGISTVRSSVKTAMDAVNRLTPQNTTASEWQARWVRRKLGLYRGALDLLVPLAGQSSQSRTQTGQLIYGLSNSLSVDLRIGPSGAPDPSVVPPELLQKIIEADTQALIAAGGNPAAPPLF